METHYDAIKNNLLKNAHITDVTAANFNKMIIEHASTGASWPGKPDTFDPWINRAVIQSNFIDFMNIKLIDGESFAPKDSFSILINEKAARIMNMDDPTGKLFYMYKEDKEYYTIKGVMKNFNFELLNKKIGPLIITNNTKEASYIYVKTTADGARNALITAETIWKQYNPDYDFTYSFLEENFEQYYKSEIQMERLLFVFAIIAIFISCIGLFGLVTYTVEYKTKEIGIRKVLGANTANIVLMLSKGFLILIGIAMIIAIPLSYYWLDTVLQDYAYHITLSWYIFMLAAGITLILTLVTVSFQSARAAMANPVDSIKIE